MRRLGPQGAAVADRTNRFRRPMRNQRLGFPRTSTGRSLAQKARKGQSPKTPTGADRSKWEGHVLARTPAEDERPMPMIQALALTPAEDERPMPVIQAQALRRHRLLLTRILNNGRAEGQTENRECVGRFVIRETIQRIPMIGVPST